MIQNEIQKLYNFSVDDSVLRRLEVWKKLFVEYSSHTNLMSKNDLSVIYQKHVLDCLGITLFSGFKKDTRLLDVGCGGGFPSLILSIFFPEIKIIAMDSTGKKTKFIELVKEELGLFKLEIINDRAETCPSLDVDIITNRAVGKIIDVWKTSRHHLKKGGHFVSYKALSAKEEALSAAEAFLELKNLQIIPYNLPLSENYTRNLVIFEKG